MDERTSSAPVSTTCARPPSTYSSRPRASSVPDEILFANVAAARALRAASAAELIGLSLNEILHPDLHATAAIRRQLIAESRHVLSKLPVKLSAATARPSPP